MNLVIYFCGTGNPGDNFVPQTDYLSNNDSLRTIFVHGCDHPDVCDSTFFPDLKAFAQRFTQKLFGSNGQLKTTNKRELNTVGVQSDRSTIQNEDTEAKIDGITLCGYSRGAVTCFEVARQLNQIAPNIPVNIVADQPVPGNLYQTAGTNAASVTDCSDLKNLKNVSIILGSYTGATTSVDLHVKKKMPDPLDAYKTSYILVGDALYYIQENGIRLLASPNANYDRNAVFDYFKINPGVEGQFSLPSHYLTNHFAVEAQRETTALIHRGFFSQIVPKLPRTAQRDLILIPRESHHQDRVNAPSGEEHMHMQMAKYLHQDGLVSEDDVANKTEAAKKTYSTTEYIPANPFPSVNQMQNFFGLKKEEAYRYLDKLHPEANLRKGMRFKRYEEIIEWWKRHDKNTSIFSTQLTKDLVKVIEGTEINNVEQLKTLLYQADSWLVQKEFSSTSRYDQVECLRNNIHYDLIRIHKVPKEELAQLNRKCLQENNYYLKHWTTASQAASWFKTSQTRTLDQAFADHAQVNPFSEEADRTLLAAMHTWIEAKRDSNSSRYDLVVAMSEQLEEVIKDTYSNNAGMSLNQNNA